VGALRVSARRRPDGIVVVLTGELDLADAGRLRGRALKLDRDAPAVLYVDLRNLTFLDSSGLQALVEIDARVRADGRRVVFVRGPSTVHRVFELTRLAERVEFVEDLPPE
jgi:anti-anti-sigma factor